MVLMLRSTKNDQRLTINEEIINVERSTIKEEIINDKR
jgi:hypothetical protein